ncbi:MAG: DNA gyrase subunit A, partial [Oscillospiraceae bacterium]
CETAVALIRNPDHRIADTLKAPDFPGGGFIVYDEDEINKIYETGRGSVKVRSRYNYDKSQNCIEITEIPPSTTVEAIMDKIVDHVKSGKIREVADMRDETDLSGLKLAIDLKRGVDPDKLMLKLFKTTPLEDNYSCNFNILIGGTPRVMGVREILTEWTAFRTDCVKRRVYFDLQKKSDKLHLLEGLSKILLDIDKAIQIIRKTEEESEVVPNLMIGFSIDEIQAEYVAEIKLRHLNRQYILKRTEEISQLEKDIEEMRAILADDRKVRKLIIKELGEVAKKYGKPRRSLITFADDGEAAAFEEELPDYPVNLFFSREGYFKKITPQSLRMSSEQKLKEGDEVFQHIESTNAVELLFFTDKCQVYKSRASDFDDTKASVLGEYVPAKLGMDSEEKAVFMAATKDYGGYMLFLYENGKLAKVDMQAYYTKTRRKKLLSAYSDKAGLAGMLHIPADCEVVLRTTGGRVLLLDTALVLPKSAKNTQGIAVLTLARGQQIADLRPLQPEEFENPARYRAKSLPARGAMLSPKDVEEQTTLL